MKYIASTEVLGLKGDPFSAYFGIVNLDDNGQGIDRRFRFLDDFSGIKKRINLPFRATSNQIFLMYRINTETVTKSNCEYSLLPIDKTSITLAKTGTTIDSFDIKKTSAWKKINKPKNISKGFHLKKYADVNYNISFMDNMYMADPIEYFKIGQQTPSIIELGLRLVGKSELDIKKILDLPCGYGRVIRFLRANFPKSAITACDIETDAVDFCTKTFDSIPLNSQEDFSQLQINDKFDLIWCGSLLTHIDINGWKSLLEFFMTHLANQGLLFFTVHGRHYLRLIKETKKTIGLNESKKESIVNDYENTGFGFARYTEDLNYGISLASPSFVMSILENYGGMRFVIFFERGWRNHDVIVMQKLG